MSDNDKERKSLDHVRDWKYIIQNWDYLLKNSRSTILRSLRLGVPTKYRGEVWYLLTNAKEVKAKANFTYASLNKTESNSTRIISVDVPRTLPTWQPATTTGLLDQLQRLLNAYANVDPELGYTQGMNFIASMFLIYQSEEDAFWSFYSLMYQSSLPHRLFFVSNFPKLTLHKQIVDQYIFQRFPEVYHAFEERKLDSTIFTPMWFMVCFLSANFDLDMSTFIFEQFLAFGIAPLLSFGLGILEIHKNTLREDGFEVLLQTMTNPGNSPLMKDKQRINAAWGKHWITTKEYKRTLQEVLKKRKQEEERKKQQELEKQSKEEKKD